MSNTNNFNFGQTLMSGLASSLGGTPGSLIGNAIGGLFSNMFGSFAAHQQFKYQSRLQQQQFDLQKQMFDYTSAYNSPVNAVQRYKDAGLNPNLLTGQTQQSGTTGSIGQGQAGLRQVQSQFDLSQHSQMAMIQQKLQSDIDLSKSQTDLNKFKAINEWYNSLDKELKLKYADDLYRFNRDYMEHHVIREKNEGLLALEQSISEIAKRNHLNAQAEKAFSDIVRNMVLNNVSASDIEVNAKKIQEMDSNISYRNALILQVKAMESYVKQQTKTEEQQTAIKSYEATNWHQLTNNEIAEQNARIFNYYKTHSGITFPVIGGGVNTQSQPAGREILPPILPHK